MKNISFGVMLMCASFFSFGQDSNKAQSSHAFWLFYHACVKNNGNPEKVSAWAKDLMLPKLKNPSSFLPDEINGTAWSTPNSIGKFVLSVTEDFQCSVYAEKSSASELERLYDELIFSMGKDGVFAMEKKIDQSELHEGNRKRDIEHQAHISEAGLSLLIRVRTDSSPDASVQGLLSLILIKD